MLKSWLLLFATICAEVSGTTCMKLSDGFTKPLPVLGVIVLYGLSFWGLSVVVRDIELGTAYAVWSGVGTALVALLGVFFFGDRVTLFKVLSICMIIAGVVGLKLASDA